MRYTLRYSGTLADPSSASRLQEDFQDIARTHRWPVDLLEREETPSRGGGTRLLAPPLALKGLTIVVHPQTDPLWFAFDEGGVLTRLGSFSVAPTQRPAGAVRSLGFLHQSQASIQTGIGGSALHTTVVGLLDYLKSAYVPDLNVQDDTGYWDHRDAEALRALMDRN